MSIAFRVDASNKIGTWHFMRCLTLADIATKALEIMGKDASAVKGDLPEPVPHDVLGEWFKEPF